MVWVSKRLVFERDLTAQGLDGFLQLLVRYEGGIPMTLCSLSEIQVSNRPYMLP